MQSGTITNKNPKESIGTRIAKAVNGAKRLSERIIGYIPYEINFVKATYRGKTQRPAKISPIEKGIVGILLVDGTSSFKEIGAILGLDVVNDNAERMILRSAIDGLLRYNAIEGDDSFIALTESGKAYAEKGERPDTYSKSFCICVDLQNPSWHNIKNCLEENINDTKDAIELCDNLNLSLEQIQTYAEYQAQDVHFPQNRYMLENAVWEEGHNASYQVYVCFVQNVASDEVRAFVYDEKTGHLNELIAEHINAERALKLELLSNCIHLECENDNETKLLEGEDVEVAKSEISIEIKEAERQMILEELEANEKLDDSNKNSETTSKKDGRLHKKALYDSLSFEVELQKIFKEDNPDEIWLISPWIKKDKNGYSVFVDQRGPAIESFLQDEKKKVFVAYSAPAITKSGKYKMDENGNISSNIDSEVQSLIMMFEEQYPNFFFVELPEFHIKNVIEVKSDQHILFTGSFNVLSFSVSECQTHIRREEMTLAHHNVAKRKYFEYQYEFAERYATRILEQIQTADDSSMVNYKNERLDYFLSINNAEIQKLFLPIEELIEEKALAWKKQEVEQTLTKISQDLQLANKGGLKPKDKKHIESILCNVENELKVNGIDDPSIIELFRNSKELLDCCHAERFFPEKKVSQRNTQKQLQSITNKSEIALDNAIESHSCATIATLSYHIASLRQAYFNREIKKTELNIKLLEIVQKEEYLTLLEMVSVRESQKDANAFDLSLGINGYLFIFPTLFKEKETFECKMKKASKRLIPVNQNNIEEVVKKLS